MGISDDGPGSVIEILKQALYLERQGKAFYTKVAEQAETEGVRTIFSTLAAEEESHIIFLSSYFTEYSKTGHAGEIGAEGPDTVSAEILTDEIKGSIKAASYEAAAISASIEMEKKAVMLYSGRAKTAEDEKEKELYEKLSRWEMTHLDLLMDLDRGIIESVWNENSFWPY